MVNHYDYENEAKRLAEVEKALKSSLELELERRKDYKGKERKINKEMWEDVGGLRSDLDEIISFLQYIRSLKNNLHASALSVKEINKYERLIQSPYFARIDFAEEGEAPESFYIGIYGFKRDDTGEIYIYDWRAPVSSMFYDFETGKAHYSCPVGQIDGELTLKRQYRIENGSIKLMFDSSIAIEDEILQEILAGSSDGSMKTIVATIQREQNRAIRNERSKVLAVQGPAGSGKTSVALHRAAYLLYRYRESIEAANILLFTPNTMFSNYISSVLPELGEEELPCMTITGLAAEYMGDSFHTYGTYASMMERQLLEKKSSSVKASEQFATQLEKKVQRFEDDFTAEDIGYSDIIYASKAEIEELFKSTLRHMPIYQRFARMSSIIEERIWKHEKELIKQTTEELAKTGEHVNIQEMKAVARMSVTAGLEPVRTKMRKMLSADPVKLYIELLEELNQVSLKHECIEQDSIKQDGTKLDRIEPDCTMPANLVPDILMFAETLENLKAGVLDFEDQAPLLYMMLLTGNITKNTGVKQLIIDEAQDYPVAAYRLFSRLYADSGMTILGDFRQNINPGYGIGDLNTAAEILGSGKSEYIELDKSYRSTTEIMEFAERATSFSCVPFGRSGRVPEVWAFRTNQDLVARITSLLEDIEDEGVSTVAVICRTLQDSLELFEKLKEGQGRKPENIYLADNGDAEIKAGTVIIPSYLSKGLEFDAVICVIGDRNDYGEDERQLFYTVCTRALHRLEVIAPEGSWIHGLT